MAVCVLSSIIIEMESNSIRMRRECEWKMAYSADTQMLRITFAIDPFDQQPLY